LRNAIQALLKKGQSNRKRLAFEACFRASNTNSLNDTCKAGKSRELSWRSAPLKRQELECPRIARAHIPLPCHPERNEVDGDLGIFTQQNPKEPFSLNVLCTLCDK
jgi:hypothetical protein